MKKIPYKNYIILGTILVFSVTFVLYLNNWYKQTGRTNEKKSIILDTIKEVKFFEIDNYIIENPNFVIYLSSKEENKNASFEKKLKKLIIDNDLKQYFVFVNLDDVNQTDYSSFLKKYSENSNNNYKLSDSIIIIDNQKITSLIIKKDKFNISDVKKALKENEVY